MSIKAAIGMVSAVVAAILVIGSGSLRSPSPETLAQGIQLLGAHTVDYTNSDGKTFPMVMVRWRNNTDRDIYNVEARFELEKNTGVETVDSYTIFTTLDNPPVPPGGEFEDAPGEGFAVVLLPGEVLEDVHVSISAATSEPDSR